MKMKLEGVVLTRNWNYSLVRRAASTPRCCWQNIGNMYTGQGSGEEKQERDLASGQG